jgi:hypothetical protein
MGQRKRSKAKKKNPRRVRVESPRSSAPKRARTKTDEVRQLDAAAQAFEGAAERLQDSLENLRATLPSVVTLGIQRDRSLLVKALIDEGILDSLQRLGTALESCGSAAQLAPPLVPLQRIGQIVLAHLCRAFEVEPVHQPGDLLTLTEERFTDFDWSADPSEDNAFPVTVEILQSGWKTQDRVFVLPKVRVIRAASEIPTG